MCCLLFVHLWFPFFDNLPAILADSSNWSFIGRLTIHCYFTGLVFWNTNVGQTLMWWQPLLIYEQHKHFFPSFLHAHLETFSYSIPHSKKNLSITVYLQPPTCRVIYQIIQIEPKLSLVFISKVISLVHKCEIKMEKLITRNRAV